MLPMTAIVALAALTYGMRLAGPLLRGRVTVPAAAERLFADSATVLLIALAATSALTAGHGFAGARRRRRHRAAAPGRPPLAGFNPTGGVRLCLPGDHTLVIRRPESATLLNRRPRSRPICHKCRTPG
jgi:hypothetical protein